MNDSIKKYLISENITILEAMKRINDGGKGVAYICHNKKLVASVTDGDIRRAILNNQDVSEEIGKIANYNPMYLFSNKKKYYKSFMEEHMLTSIPILNDSHEIIDIIFLYDNKEVEGKMNVPVYIMAGGKGTRLSPYTDILPKPLIPIGEKTITEHIMDRFAKYGCSEFAMIVNYKKGLIKAYFNENETKRNVKFIDENTFLGTGGGLKLINPRVTDTIFVTNCDILIEGDYTEIYNYHKKQKNIITMVCVKKTEVIPYGTIMLNEEDRVVEIKEKPSFSFNTNTGLYLVEPEFIDLIPDNAFIHITDTIEKCIKDNLKVGAYFVSEENWMDMGELEKLKSMEEKIGFSK